MATLVKEKHREKKKKEKNVTKQIKIQNDFKSLTEPVVDATEKEIVHINTNSKDNLPKALCSVHNKFITEENVVASSSLIVNTDKGNLDSKQEIDSNTTSPDLGPRIGTIGECSENDDFKMYQKETDSSLNVNSLIDSNLDIVNTYKDLNEKLVRIQIHPYGQTTHSEVVNDSIDEDIVEKKEESTTPSAPVLDVPKEEGCNMDKTILTSDSVTIKKARVLCMPLEEAIRIFGGKEIAEVKIMSEREEAAVEMGPLSGPEHPLVDLLSTFRSSLLALERERISINCGYNDEEKRRALLWKIEKRSITLSEKCPCGANVDLRVVYDYAELQKDRLPAAKLRLEGLLRDVQDSYCHHQHAVLLAHCQIEELISETVQSNKGEIREALALVLQALRLSDGAPAAFPQALERWATVLVDALVDERDLRQLLFVIHHLFRQSRSVQWAGSVLRVRASDASSAARLIAILDVLLTGCACSLDNALECTEELEAWEEVDVRGDGGAVGEGRLRERDLLIVLNSLPLKDLVARLALFARSDISKQRESEWGDPSGGHGVLKACCGARALLDAAGRGARALGGYPRLRARLRALAAAALHALAALHMHSRSTYTKELEARISAELEACFAAGLRVLGEEPERLPAALLSDDAAREYCMAFENLHDKSTRRIESLDMEAPALGCAARVAALAQVAADRALDRELATAVLQFLLQTGMKSKTVKQKCSCDAAARERVSRLVDAHPHLHTTALHIFADISQGESIDSALVKYLNAPRWRPAAGEVQAVLRAWTQRCPQLIPCLLLDMDYTPHSGVSLESQLCIGWWVSQIPEAPDWAWTLLQNLHLHRSHWALPFEAPALDKAPDTLLETIFAILATDWGHSVPLACGPGVDALHRLAVSRPKEAVHCLGRLVSVMAHSPESISLTPRFSEVVTVILNWGPNLVQRALGRGGQSGADLLQNLVLQQLLDVQLPSETRSALLTAWLHALWTPTQVGSSRGILDAAVRATRDWRTLDAYVSTLMQEENSKQYIEDALRHASAAPLLCESVLRRAHGAELAGAPGRVLAALAAQRGAGLRIHVDNALKQVGATMSSDELVIHRAASAVLNVPFSHPAHLTLWRLFFHLYLQRPPDRPLESSPPVGPLFFSGLVKTRALAQLKKRLQDTIVYHHNAAESLKRSESIDTPDISSRKIERSPTSDNIFPQLSIIDMVEQTSDESTGSDEDDKGSEGNVVEEMELNANSSLISYHNGAEKLVREYSRWLEEGDKVRACPHHADVARFIPEQALSAAWGKSLAPRTPRTPSTPAFPSEGRVGGMVGRAPLTHYERAIRAINAVRDKAHRRRKKRCVKSLVEHVNFKETRAVLQFIDQHLAEVEKFAREWAGEVQRLAQLDGQLWQLVGRLRARRPLPPVSERCPQGCRPLTVRVAEDEWCISTAAEREIQENRRLSRASVRRLCRARPHFARTAAALLVAAKCINNVDTAVGVCERVWRHTPLARPCAHAQHLLANVVTLLAEKWICHDASRSAELLSRWSRGDCNQQLLCSALVSPTKLPINEWVQVYIATCQANLPSHATFSYLSKFDMSRWARSVDGAQRQAVLRALAAAAQRWGPQPDAQHHVLIELLGVHSLAAVSAAELGAHAGGCLRRAAAGALPPDYCRHLTPAVQAHAAHLTFDQIGHLLRELGAIWWEARNGPSNRDVCPQYAPHVAAVLTSLQRAFVAAALDLSYAPERVTLYAWSSLLESWSAWVSPHPPPPLLPAAREGEKYTEMLQHFVACINQVMEDCPDSTESLLLEVWCWAVDTYGASGARSPQEGRVQLSALLAALGQLPWHLQWFRPACLPRALQISQSADREITSWCSAALGGTRARTWLRTAPDAQLAPALAALFELLTSSNMQFSQQCLSESCGVPWWRLPAPALDQLLEQFYRQHHNPGLPYHELPHFNVVLSACQLLIHPSAPAAVVASVSSHEKRCRSVSQYVRAVVSPALHSHLREHVKRLLHVITELAPHIESAPGQLEDILSRAIVIMCMEPAAKIVLPVFIEWMSSCNSALRAASVSAVGTLTSFDYFLPLADSLVKVHMQNDVSGWRSPQQRWAEGAWWEAGACVRRGGLHAAYGLHRARSAEHAPARLADTITALINAEINFSENEEIVALWICVACRAALSPGGGGEEEGAEECRGAARELLDRWAVETKRSLLQVVALQSTAPAPTPRHRLLCRFAQCITSPSETAARSYEASVTAVLGSTPGDVITWHKTPSVRKLVQLANKLYPNKELYFREELEMAEKSN